MHYFICEINQRLCISSVMYTKFDFDRRTFYSNYFWDILFHKYKFIYKEKYFTRLSPLFSRIIFNDMLLIRICPLIILMIFLNRNIKPPI